MNSFADPKAWLDSPAVRAKAVMLIWTYDTIRFLLLFDILETYSVNPFLFFFLDMVTVPFFVKGWTCLIRSLSDSSMKIQVLINWSVITFIMSTAPYLYAAWAGRQAIPDHLWIVLSGVIVFPMIKIIRTVLQPRQMDKKSIIDLS